MATNYDAQVNGTTHAKFNDPAGVFGAADASDIGPQIRNDYYQKKALIEARKKQYFTQFADTTAMPKNMGKTIKRFHYLPLLDDANINDQGIDAAGLQVNQKKTIIITKGDEQSTGNGWVSYYAVGEGVDSAAATTAAEAAAMAYFATTGIDITDPLYDTYAEVKAYVEGLTPAWTVDDTIASVMEAGNLYGSSKDVGTISSKLPALTENGGRVNRVGFKRIELEGTLEKFGFFDEYTQESLDFDTDAELDMHVNREMINGANEITEDALQIDILNSAGVVRYGGTATSKATITGDDGVESLITYEDLMRLSIDLDNNRVPKATKIITGSRMVDTKVVDAARYMLIGSELIPMFKRMKDLFDNQAFIPVQQYASAGNLAVGEIGTVDQFRIIVVPEMMHWEGAGAVAGTDTSTGGIFRKTGGNYDVFPMLVLGSESFTTIGFQTDGKTVKFKITHKKPGKAIANRDDPYGEVGFMSIKWYYGFMLLRPERIALCMSVAEL